MRIIAGTHRGRRLKAPKGQTTRPTLDRVREALFSILGDITGLQVADCYAGTGALGMESLSRGAAHAVLVEADKFAFTAIKENLLALELSERCTPLHARVERLERLLTGRPKLDLVLADSPWPIAQAAALVIDRVVTPHLADNARVVLGHPADAPVDLPDSSRLELVERRSWGGSAMSFYRLGTPSTYATNEQSS